VSECVRVVLCALSPSSSAREWQVEAREDTKGAHDEVEEDESGEEAGSVGVEALGGRLTTCFDDDRRREISHVATRSRYRPLLIGIRWYSGKWDARQAIAGPPSVVVCRACLAAVAAAAAVAAVAVVTAAAAAAVVVAVAATGPNGEKRSEKWRPITKPLARVTQISR